MKLRELSESETNSKGTYAGVRFSDETCEHIKKFLDENNIKTPLEKEKLHTTLLYSRKFLPNYKPAGAYKHPMKGVPRVFEIWESQPDENGETSNCLVLLYTCPELVKRHEELMKEHDAQYDYDVYKPHITFSYDAGDVDVDKLPKFPNDIEIVSEYHEDLNLNWASEHGN